MFLVAISTCPGPARLPENRLAPLNVCGKTEDRVELRLKCGIWFNRRILHVPNRIEIM